MKKDVSNRQLEIIEAAGKLLMENGIKGLTTKNLANEIGFSESALYRHFKNKEDIIVLMIDNLLQNIQNRFQNLPLENKTSSEKIKEVFNSQFNYFSNNPHFIIVALSEGLFDETETITNSLNKVITYKTEFLSKIIEQGKTTNELTSQITTIDLIHILLGSFRLMMFKWKLSKFQINLVKEGNNIIESNIKLMKL